MLIYVLYVPVTDALHQECESLRSVVIINSSGRGELDHKLDEVAKVLLQECGFTTQEGLEDFEGL